MLTHWKLNTMKREQLPAKPLIPCQPTYGPGMTLAILESRAGQAHRKAVPRLRLQPTATLIS